MFSKLAFTALALAAAAGALHVAAEAQAPKADPRLAAISVRQGHMKAAGASMKTLVGFSKGEIEDPAKARQAASRIVLVGRQMPKLWPAGTAVGVGKSKAKPEVWTQRRQFNARIASFRAAAAAMNGAAARGDKAAVAAQLRPLGDSCKSCHTAYQVKS